MSLQNGGIAIPGAPASVFPSTLPIFTVTGYQQIGPTAAANSKFTTSVTEFLDTFSLARGRHTLKFGTDLRREALDVVNKRMVEAHLPANRVHQRWMLDRMRDLALPGGSEDSLGVLKEADYRAVASTLLRERLIENHPDYRDFARRPDAWQ